MRRYTTRSVILRALTAALPAAALFALPALAAKRATSAVNVQTGKMPAAPGQAKPAKTEMSPQKLLHDAWWNQPSQTVEIELRKDQRAKMDSLLLECIRKRIVARARQRALRQQYRDAIMGGKLEEARRAAEELSKSVTERSMALYDLKIDVLSVLDAKQRRTIMTLYPGLLRKAWIKTPHTRPRRRHRPPQEKNAPKP